MLLTPTMIGAVLAGICLWTLFWATLHKIEEIPYVRNILTTNDCLDWIQERPGLVILLTEAPQTISSMEFLHQWESALPWAGRL